jgi:hypothetical protein
MAHLLTLEEGSLPYAVAEIIDARELAKRWRVPVS